MSDHSSGGGGAGLMTLGIVTIPLVALADAYLNKHLVTTYGTLEKVPPAALENAHEMRVLFGIILFIGLAVLFPLGVWAFIKSVFGGH